MGGHKMSATPCHIAGDNHCRVTQWDDRGRDLHTRVLHTGKLRHKAHSWWQSHHIIWGVSSRGRGKRDTSATQLGTNTVG